jgi:hypothetical protein
MAVDGDFANFRAVYDDLTQEVMRAYVQFLADHISNWFRTLDTTSEVAPICACGCPVQASYPATIKLTHCLFMGRLDKEFPQWGSNFMLPFPDQYNPPETKEAAN